MKLYIHFIGSLVMAGILFPYYGLVSFLVFIGGFLIDIDHYFIYIRKFRSMDIRKAYHYFMDSNHLIHQGTFFVFHSTELLLLGIILSFRYDWALVISIGLLKHYILDLIYEMKTTGQMIKSWSFIVWIKKRSYITRNK